MNAATTPNAASQWSSWEQPSPPVSLPGAETAIVPDGSVVFNDHVWDLTPLSKRPTTRWINLNFEHTPERVRDDIKHFIHLVLTVDTPMEQLDRPAMTRRRLTPATVKTIYEDLKPFFTWLADRDVPHLANLTDEDLDDYALQVAAAPVGQNSKARRLFALTRLWLMAPYMRAHARLRQPSWERDGMDRIIGKSEWTAENKSSPIHPATMSALLVWCLRIIDEAPHVLPALRVNPAGSSATNFAKVMSPAPELVPWTGPLTPKQVDSRRRAVTVACMVTIAYLTGMRADEVLGMRRGSCTAILSGSEPTGGYEIHSRTYKSAVEGGRSIPEGVDRDHPWTAIKPVADAVTVMEQLHDNDLLFSLSLFKARLTTPRLDPGPPPSARVMDGIDHLLAWCNQRAADLGKPSEAIPDDPDGHINLRRLRRTLAWFIYRRPGGRVALGVQYGHLHAATTDGYGGRVSAGLRALFPMEEAFAISDTLHSAAEHLTANPDVSGPAAERYRAAITECANKYQGATLTRKQAAALMSNPDLRVYDSPGQTLACCFDPRKALCRKDSPREDPATTPDLTACDSRCANIARTDEHIAAIQTEVDSLREEHDSALTPEPLRHRLEAQLARRESIIRAHHETGEDER